MQIVISIMKKKNRNARELELLDQVFSDIPFFQEIKQKLPEDAYESLLRRSRYEFYKKGDTIFKEGSNYTVRLTIISQINKVTMALSFTIFLKDASTYLSTRVESTVPSIAFPT